MSKSKIEWTEATWNPVRGCSRVSPGCQRCYAEKIAMRFSRPGEPFHGFARPRHRRPCDDATYPGWTSRVELIPSKLDEPLHWKKPRRVFVNSMSDLFHEALPDEAIDSVFAVMARASQHTFQVLTKRADRMHRYCTDPATPGRVAKALDRIVIAARIAEMGPEEIRPIAGYPGYYVTDRGRVLSSSGSAACLFCGGPVEGAVNRAYCSQKCRQNAGYYRRTGRPRPAARTPVEMTPDVAEDGYRRVALYTDGSGPRGDRYLVHRLVMDAFAGPPPFPDAQVCHKDGDPGNNAAPNLRWGDQSDNWQDRKRHGNGGPTTFPWPLPNVWKGTSCEDQQRADERIPLLLQTPAAVRFVSLEPLLGPVRLDWRGELCGICPKCGAMAAHGRPYRGPCDCGGEVAGLDWAIVGGESGPGARACDVAWIRSVVRQCREAGVACFTKQWGSRPYDSEHRVGVWAEHDRRTPRKPDGSGGTMAAGNLILLRDRKGGDPAEWPEDLRVREYPS